jgi:hypothetical protein
MSYVPAISVATEISAMNSLTPTAQKFILHWGEMGARWGIIRTMAAVHRRVVQRNQRDPTYRYTPSELYGQRGAAAL